MELAMLILTAVSTTATCVSIILSISIKKDVSQKKSTRIKQKVSGDNNEVSGINNIINNGVNNVQK